MNRMNRNTRRSTRWLTAPASGLAMGLLLLCSSPVCLASIQVSDSPLYGRLLISAITDLQEISTASTQWQAPALGSSSTGVVKAERAAFVNQTILNEPTLCAKDFHDVTQCDKGTNDKQVCTKTVHSQSKTNCGGANDKSVCKDMGTRCPGDGGKNECKTTSGGTPTQCFQHPNHCGTMAPGQFTNCTDTQEPTLCLGLASECLSGDRNKCSTTEGNQKTNCTTSVDPTLCVGEQTACNSKNHNICKTAATGSGDKTVCPGTNPTTCTGAETNCTNGKVNQGCEFYSVSMTPNRIVPGDNGALVVVHAPPGFFSPGSQPFLQFLPGGPTQAEPGQVFDDDEARFYVNVPNNPGGAPFYNYQVFAFNGSGGSMETQGVLATTVLLPATGTIGAIALILALGLFAGWLLMRRIAPAWQTT